MVNFNVYMGYDRLGEDNTFRVGKLLRELDADVAALQVRSVCAPSSASVVASAELIVFATRGAGISTARFEIDSERQLAGWRDARWQTDGPLLCSSLMA